MKTLTRIKIVLITLLCCGSALAAVVTITEPRPETSDSELDLLRKAVWSLDAAADALEP